VKDNPGRGKKFLSSPECSDWLWSPPSLLFSGTQGSFTGIKQEERDVDNSIQFIFIRIVTYVALDLSTI